MIVAKSRWDASQWQRRKLQPPVEKSAKFPETSWEEMEFKLKIKR